jgi:hypothetical protein
MSVHKLVSLDAFCDECKRAFGEIDSEPANAPGVGLWTSSTRAARRDMKTYGWRAKRIYRMTLDICPDCQKGQS